MAQLYTQRVEHLTSVGILIAEVAPSHLYVSQGILTLFSVRFSPVRWKLRID